VDAGDGKLQAMLRPRLIAAAGAGYLLGTVPSADVASRIATGGATDLRTVGTGNPGAVNAMHVLGKAWGYGILFADVAKGAMASALGRGLAGDVGAHVAGTAAVVGHCFPVWNGFKGGKGAATSCGQCLMTFPVYFPVDLGVAWAMAKWRQRTFPATVVASTMWVLAGTLWWRRGWPNAWGPRPSAGLPLAAAASSGVILYKFWTGRWW
jgi:glycerol-3-phosphate acyltransferase PlsY